MSEGSEEWVGLRPWGEGDMELQTRFMGDAEMTRYLGGPESRDQIRKRHERYLAMNEKDEGRMYVIVVGPEKTPAGSVGCWERKEDSETVWETGWFVVPEFHGRNLATIGTKLLIGKLQEQHKHRYLHAYPSVDNRASNAICRKAGFTLVGPEEFEYPKGHFMTCNNWRLDLFEDAVEAGGV